MKLFYLAGSCVIERQVISSSKIINNNTSRAYFFASFITNTGEPGTSIWTCQRTVNYFKFSFIIKKIITNVCSYLSETTN